MGGVSVKLLWRPDDCELDDLFIIETMPFPPVVRSLVHFPGSCSVVTSEFAVCAVGWVFGRGYYECRVHSIRANAVSESRLAQLMLNDGWLVP